MIILLEHQDGGFSIVCQTKVDLKRLQAAAGGNVVPVESIVEYYRTVADYTVHYDLGNSKCTRGCS